VSVRRRERRGRFLAATRGKRRERENTTAVSWTEDLSPRWRLLSTSYVKRETLPPHPLVALMDEHVDMLEKVASGRFPRQG